MTVDPSERDPKTTPEADREGNIDDDRQDAPQPAKTDGSSEELDGFTATPGDDPDDDED